MPPNLALDAPLLAAFLAGTLAPEARQQVIAILSQDADARVLVRMAHEALDVAQRVPKPPAASARPTDT